MNTNIIQMINMLRQNPAQVLAQRGINISQDMINNPQAIVQYMLNNGMVSQEKVNQAMQIARQYNR